MSKDKLINRWKSQLAASDHIDNPAGFVEITDYDLVIAGGDGDTTGICCRGGNTCCCTSCTCPPPPPPVIIIC